MALTNNQLKKRIKAFLFSCLNDEDLGQYPVYDIIESIVHNQFHDIYDKEKDVPTEERMGGPYDSIVEGKNE